MLTHLTFGDYYNHPIESNVLSPILTHLVFGKDFNQQISPNVFVQTLTHLVFGEFFNQPIKSNVLPHNLIHLIFGRYFNQQFEPNIFAKHKMLTHLSLGGYCYKIDQNLLPQNLTHLTFGFYYNDPIQIKILPQSLIYLSLGKYYNHPLTNNIIPQSCQTIKLYGSVLNKQLLNNLSNYIKTIIFETLEIPINNLPSSINTIKINNYMINSNYYFQHICNESNHNILNLLEKVPYGCIIINKYNKPILV